MRCLAGFEPIAGEFENDLGEFSVRDRENAARRRTAFEHGAVIRKPESAKARCAPIDADHEERLHVRIG